MSTANAPSTKRRTFWQYLTEPSAAVQEVEGRRQARLLASLIMPLALVTMTGALVILIMRREGAYATAFVQGGASALLILSYALSRSRHYRVAAAITLVSFSAVPFAALFGQGSYAGVDLASKFVWVCLPLILSSIFLRFRGMVLLALANVIGIALIPLLIPEFTFVQAAPPIGFTLAVSGLILVTARYRDSLERERKDELVTKNQELESTQTQLVENNRSLQAAVAQYVQYAQQVAQGDLSCRLSLDEVGRPADDPLLTLGRSLNEMTASLQNIAAQMRTTAGSLSSAASEILAATTEQAAGSSQQSAAIAQASTTIDEVRTIAAQTAERASGVADISRQTANSAEVGQRAVANTIDGMNEVMHKVETIATTVLALSEQAQAIGQIITAVQDIASQSQMLALNAAVEAARAGEAGRGFAVVASEVRALAEQSRVATGQVEELLIEIQGGVNRAVMVTEEGMKGTNAGMRLTAEAGEVIRQLAEGVTNSTQASLQIASSAGQQLTGMEQISQAMQSIHQVTTQTLASTQQTERAATELHILAGQLQMLVEQYKL